ncbi:MAG: acyl-phosphate glycerol 3-phosphate acyltransferase [Betaproteobacteria bacterium]|nr:MAG: acyl-phosphate glycerol 3-phosphate acyltransferase [Betaproteobacteria bacterium]
MNQTETEAKAGADALIAVVEQMMRDTGHGQAVHAALDSSLERELGLDSLARVELVLRVERAFDVSLPERALYAAETPRDLLRLVHGSAGAPRTTPEKGIRSLVQAEPGVVACAAETLLDALDWHMARHPQRLHVHLYAENGEEEISYAALGRGAAAYASRLAGHGLQPGQTVAIMLPTGRDYLFSFFGILMAGGIPVPLYPPARPTQIEEHLRRHVGILDNCRAAMLITIPEAKTVALLLRSRVESLQQVLMPDDLAGGDAGFTQLPANPGDIAFLQYTSGSTGNPKGVVLTHANLVTNIRAMGEAVQASANDVFVSWLPLYHDMGLIGAWFAALYLGFPTVLMSPLAFLSHPSRWLWAIHRHRGTLSGGPNFCYELCLKRIEDAELEGLDLSCWRYAFNGAEPVSPETLTAFEQRFARHGLSANTLQPVYGLAEATVGLAFPPPGTHYRIDRIQRAAFQNQGEARPAAPEDAAALEVPCCGRVISAHYLRVVDSAGVELADRQEGRLQFTGPSATSGYFRNPEQTRKLFAGAWLDTGDLAYLADGELYLSGRAKDIIIRGGRNLYPYELEQAVGALPGVRKGCVAVFGSIDPRNGTERVVVLAETRETAADVLHALRRSINERAIDLIGLPADDIVLAPPHTVLKTSSGKIRRAASREYYESGGGSARPAPVWLQLARLARASLVPELRRQLRAWSGLAYSAWVGLCFLILAVPSLIAAALLRSPARGWRFSRVMAIGFLRLCRLPLMVHGLEHIPASGPFVMAVNHASYLDGLILVAALRERGYRFVAKRELRESLLPRLFLQSIGTDFVERSDIKQGVEDASRLAESVRAGHTPVFFAEGTFTRSAGLLPFRMGAFVIAAQTGVPLVPVAIRGARSVLRDNNWFARRGAIVVNIAPPLLPQGSDWNAAVALRDAARAEILRRCGEPDLASSPLPGQVSR